MKKKPQINEYQWFIITVISSNEDSIVKNLKSKIEAFKLSELVQDIKIIKDRKVEILEEYTEDTLPSNYGRNLKNIVWEGPILDKNGHKKFRKIKDFEENRFPGYIFIKMLMTKEAWFVIRNTTQIMGILGSSGKNTPPTPVSEDEIEAILNIKTDSEGVIVNQDDGSQNKIISTEDSVIFEKIHIKSPFLVDQIVYIKQGNFKDEQAKVISFNETTGKALISYDFWGIQQEVEFDFDDLTLEEPI